MKPRRIPPDAVRLILWAGSLTFCAAAYLWNRIDQALHPADPDTP